MKICSTLFVKEEVRYALMLDLIAKNISPPRDQVLAWILLSSKYLEASKTKLRTKDFCSKPGFR